MRLHGSASHLELAGDLGVVTALQKQFNNLLLARSQPDRLLRHHYPLVFWIRPCLYTGADGMFPDYIAPTMPLRNKNSCDPRTSISTGTWRQSCNLRNCGF